MKSSGWPLCVALLGMVGCSGKPAFDVTNSSSQRLTNIVISGAGFKQRIESLAAGGKASFAVRPTGDTSLSVSFDANEKRIDAPDQGLAFKGSFRVAIQIKADLTVSVVSELHP
jgi:hypothetical protein